MRPFTKKIEVFILAFLLIFISSCGPKPVQPELTAPVTSSNPCPRPPPAVLEALDFDLELAVSGLSSLSSGSVKLGTDSKIFTTVSQAALDDRTRSYIRCVSIKIEGYSAEQAAWLDSLSTFKSTNPTPQDFSEYLSRHPFPKKPPFDSETSLKNAEDACFSGEFNKAKALYRELLIRNPQNPLIIQSKQNCERVENEPKVIEIGMLVSPAVFMYGEGNDMYFARFSLEVEDSYCGSISNKRHHDFEKCTVTPGLNKYKMKRLKIYEPNGDVLFANGTCGGHFNVSPKENTYGFIICLNKPMVRCAAYPILELYDNFDYKKCIFN